MITSLEEAGTSSILSLSAIFQRAIIPVAHRFPMSGAGTGLTKGIKSGNYQMMPKMGVQSTVEPEEGVPPVYKGERRKLCSIPIAIKANVYFFVYDF